MNSEKLMQAIRGASPAVVLVGNGPTACDHPLGELIDLFDEVVRFNNYHDHIKGAEKEVGTKTSTWVLGEHMSGKVRPLSGEQLLRIVPRGLSQEFYADAVFIREIDGVDFPSSGLVMASKFGTLNMKVYTVGMDGYHGSKRNWWNGGSECRQHDPECERAYWNSRADQFIPLAAIV